MIEEKIIVGEGTQWALNGLLTLPGSASNNSPVPAVVLVQGSGTSDMDSHIKKVRPFKDIAEGLAQRGIATIRYNKRSFQYARKMIKAAGNSLTVKEEVIDDVLLAASILRNDPRINPQQVYMAGLSMGGALALRINAEGGNFAGLIIMAGSPRSLGTIMLDQAHEQLQTGKGIMGWIVKRVASKMIPKLESLGSITDEEAKATKMSGGTTLYYFKDFENHPVPAYLEKTTVPMLIIQGERDLQVKVDPDFKLYKELLAGRDDVTFKLYEGLNHAFMTAHYDTIADALKEFNHEQHVKDYVIDDIANWISAQATQPVQPAQSDPSNPS